MDDAGESFFLLLPRYCLDDDHYLSCNADRNAGHEGGTNNHCVENATTPSIGGNTEVSNQTLSCKDSLKEKCKKGMFHICDKRQRLMRRCDDCVEKADCDRQFTAEMLNRAFTIKLLHGFYRFSLMMLIDGDDHRSKITFKGSLKHKEALSKCDETPFCRVNGKRVTGSSCPKFGNTTTMCSYPNSLGDECAEFPCRLIDEIYESMSEYENEELRNRTVDDTPTSWEYFLSEKILAVSVISLFITVSLYAVTPEIRNRCGYFQVSCFLTYLMSNVFILVSSQVGSLKILCISSAVMLHFFLLSSFTWMLVTGSVIFKTLYSMMRQIAQPTVNAQMSPERKYITSHVIGHALPGIFVVGCVSSDQWFHPQIVAYGQGEEYCWISNRKALLVTFIIPSGALLLVNIGVFVACCVSFLFIYFRNRNASSTINHWWSFFVLAKLLVGSGMQWLFGVISHFYPENEIVKFIFVFLVSVHGILILLSTLLMKPVRSKIWSFRRRRSVVVINVVSN